MSIKYKATQNFKDAVNRSEKTKYVLAQEGGMPREIFSLFVNKAFLSSSYKDRIIKIGSMLGIDPDECLEAVEDQNG